MSLKQKKWKDRINFAVGHCNNFLFMRYTFESPYKYFVLKIREMSCNFSSSLKCWTKKGCDFPTYENVRCVFLKLIVY